MRASQKGVNMRKLIGLLGACAVASFGFVACTVTSDSSSSGLDGGRSDSSTSGDSATTGETSTTTDGGGDGGSCTVTDPISTDTACNTCVQSNCCEKLNACTASSDCIALDQCVSACFTADGGSGDAGTQCADDCIAAHPASETMFVALDECLGTSCSTACGF